MRLLFLTLVVLLINTNVLSQPQKKIQKSWIKTSIENLSGKEIEPDTLYTRYSFTKAALYISFYPAWDDYKRDWSVSDNTLTIGFDDYKIEELTDSSLTIAAKGFRRFRFLAEDYCSQQEKNLVKIGDFNGKPLYKANNFITPRYTSGSSLKTVIQKTVEGFNIKKASYFLATFIVTEEGKVENVQIVKGLTEGFDKEIIKQLTKTSKDWKPALFKGRPIQTQLNYEIKYLDSITPYNSGSTN